MILFSDWLGVSDVMIPIRAKNDVTIVDLTFLLLIPVSLFSVICFQSVFLQMAVLLRVACACSSVRMTSRDAVTSRLHGDLSALCRCSEASKSRRDSSYREVKKKMLQFVPPKSAELCHVLNWISAPFL